MVTVSVARIYEKVTKKPKLSGASLLRGRIPPDPVAAILILSGRLVISQCGLAAVIGSFQPME
jgi:hypothetical protein